MLGGCVWFVKPRKILAVGFTPFFMAQITVYEPGEASSFRFGPAIAI
jgi:hypothetical protein